MSAVILLTPVVIAAWPAISGAAAAVMVSMGYVAVKTTAEVYAQQNSELNVDQEQTVELDLENSEVVGETLAREQELVYEKDGVTVKFRRDIRGKLQICVSGEGKTDAELNEIGSEIAGKVIQQYAYNQVVSEFQDSNMMVVDQEVDEDQTIRIKLRAWD